MIKPLTSLNQTPINKGTVAKQLIACLYLLTLKLIEWWVCYSLVVQKTFTTDKQPEGLRADLKLHKYQREGVAWMKTIEDDAKKRMHKCTHMHDICTRTRICVGIHALAHNVFVHMHMYTRLC